MATYLPGDSVKKQYLLEQIASMQVTYYRNIMDTKKVNVLRKQAGERWASQYDQKLNEFKLQNDEIETTIDIMSEELGTLGEE